MKKILIAILGLVVLGISFIVCNLIIGGILSLLFKLPLIGAIVGFLIRGADGAPGFLVAGLSMFVSFFFMMYVLERSAKDDALMSKSLLIIAWVIIVVHSLSLIINLIYQDAIYTNIVFLIAGLYLRYEAKSSK